MMTALTEKCPFEDVKGALRVGQKGALRWSKDRFVSASGQVGVRHSWLSPSMYCDMKRCSPSQTT